MSGTVFYFTTIEGGQFTNRKLRALIAELEGQRVEITLRKRRSYRTDPQNRAFHGPVLRPITSRMRELGVTGFDQRSLIRESEVKELLKGMFLRREVVDPTTGEVFTLIGETHRLTKAEMADFITQCIAYAAEPPLGLTIVIGPEDEMADGIEVR